MTIYRVQDRDGRGPFRPGFSHKWVQDREDHDNLVPWFVQFPNIFSKSILGMHLGCGCKTISQLRRWFAQAEYDKLKLFGYTCVSLEVETILDESDIQCVFQRAKPMSDGATPADLY